MDGLAFHGTVYTVTISQQYTKFSIPYSNANVSRSVFMSSIIICKYHGVSSEKPVMKTTEK